jgi:hypothetical protein
MKKYGFVYVWFDRKHKRYYVGSHWGAENDRYVCSSNWMKKAYKRRPQDFKRRVVSRIYTNRNDLMLEEQRWLDMIKPSEISGRHGVAGQTTNCRYYNLQLTVSLIDYENRRKMPEEARKRQGETLSKRNLERFPVENRYKPLHGEELIELHRQNSTEMWKIRDKIEHGKKISEAKKAKGTSLESRERYRQAALKREAAKRAVQLP